MLAGSPTAQLTTRSLTKWAVLSIAAALLTMALKFAAWRVTGSAGLLSDAVESSVNLIAALTVLLALWYGTRPVDSSHQYGHEKIEFFASAVEGGLILAAAGGIIWFGVQRLLDPQPLESLGIGLAIALVSSVINFIVATQLSRVARAHDSIALAADGHHLMTDFWTSIGVVVGLVAVSLTGWERLDPLIAILVALNIIRTGIGLLRVSFDGLMDKALPVEEQERIKLELAEHLPEGVEYHALRTRRAGSHRFIGLHVLVPGRMQMSEAHEIAKQLESEINALFPSAETTIHLEPREDPDAWSDSKLIQVEKTIPDFYTPRVSISSPGGRET